MPQRLKQRQEKIQNKRKQTSWREFVKEVCSWMPLNLYKNNDFISRYPVTDRIENIVSHKIFEEERNSDKNFKKSSECFFCDLKSLLKLVPKTSVNRFFGENENCDYADHIYGAKDIYLSFCVGLGSEKVLYSFIVNNNCTNIHNSMYITSSDNVYNSVAVDKSYEIFYSKNISGSSKIWFSDNLIGCQNCIDCSSLINKNYCIHNKQYTKEEYENIKKKVILDFKNNKFDRFLKKASNYNTHNSQGQGLLNCENIQNSYFSTGTFNGNNLLLVSYYETPNKNFYDGIDIGDNSCDFYGAVSSGTNSNNIYNSCQIGESSNIYYSYNLESCSYCLGCIGLKNKSYCILNKQYIKEERYNKVDEIFTQMEKDGILGKFFPGSMNPFYFNDTAAYLIDDSFTKKEVEAEGYLRRDEKIKVDIPEGAEIVYVENPNNVTQSEAKSPATDTMDSSATPLNDKAGSEGQLDDYQGRKVGDKFYPISEIGNKIPKAESGAERYIDPEILNKVIQDQEGNYYKIVKMEYDFLMKHGLPLPKLHWLDRIKLGFKFK